MVDARPGGAGPLPSDQRRIRRSPLLFTAPLVLLVLLVLVLVWESVRANIGPGAQDDWPWRLQLLDTDVLGSLLAVAAGGVLARAQYARTVRPYLGWRGRWVKDPLSGDAEAWRVGMLNGGQHIAAVESCAYAVVLAGGEAPSRPRWNDLSSTVAELVGAGLAAAEDFRLIEFGRGFPLVGTGTYETVLVGAFSREFVERVDALYVRVRVTDVVGDTHERIGDCMKGARVATRFD
ncbi:MULTISPECIES: hypothetical protein [unclassified Streptomyces]|uniref:hypothetical protein n=1 Tax=unclassified Streptomyces TaxID=2593676 RepID=UPI0035D7EF14